MSESLCDTCKHESKKTDEKPCNTCVQLIDGELDYINYETKE
jgi:hypothetical protein